MCRRAGIFLLAILAGAVALSASPSASLAASQAGLAIKSHFDLPAEPLDKALRDLAVQANCNISYEPSMVAGISAPAVNGDFTVEDALSLLLKNTSLRVVNVNADTIQILAGSQAAARAWGPEVTPGQNDITEIVVTGSHLRGVSSASPVMEIGREEIERSGYSSITDLMLSLPQNFGGGINPGTGINNSPVNSNYANNPTGESVPNLRGLGPGSTLTLLDGHRMAAGLPGGGADISSIPLEAVERIEVVTDSASAIYGSDAVAGVVNIILKRDYQGAKSDLSYGFASQGGATERRASQLFGANWTGGNGMIAYEYLQQDGVDARQRDFTSSVPDPYSLLPSQRTNSVTLSATQELSSAASVFADALYIDREADSVISDPSVFPAPTVYPATLRKYAVTAGFNFNLWRDWKATLFGDTARDATTNDDVELTTPPTPSSAQQLQGTMHNVEANANGSVGTLPAGPVRLAVGVGYRREAFSDELGFTAASLTSAVDSGRSIRYAFGELSLPLVSHADRPGLNSLDLVLSGRSERYSDVGDKTVPKVGLVYAPVSSIKLRSTWGQAFKAPNLYDSDGVRQLAIFDLADPGAPAGIAPTLLRLGGNPSLQPETADAWSLGVDYSDPAVNGFQLSATAFQIKYRNRISEINDPFQAYTDPANAFFVTPSASAGFAQSVFNEYPPTQVFNETGAPFNPGGIVAVVDGRMVNVARQTAQGEDINAGYKIDTGAGTALLFLNGTFLDLTQQDTPQSSEQTLTGIAFYPPKFRMRAGVTWTPGAWAFTGTVNYLARESNTQVTPSEQVSSWTTVDASIRYTPALHGAFSGLHFSVAALNVFDRDPPYMNITFIPGLNFDSSNTSAMGRFINLQVSKQW
jgi:outer membrane receptor protein involved in Fe transport